MTLQCAFVNTEQEPIKREHICFSVSRQNNGERTMLLLEKWERVYYPHPDAPDAAIVYVIRSRTVGMRSPTEFEAAPYLLLEAAQANAFKAV